MRARGSRQAGLQSRDARFGRHARGGGREPATVTRQMKSLTSC